MISRSTLGLMLLAAVSLVLAGCGKKTDKTAKPAGDNQKPPADTTSGGPHGGRVFHLDEGHDVNVEIVFTKEPRAIELYIVDHDDHTKGAPASDEEVTLTGLKHDGKAIDDVVLKADPLEGETDGSSRFKATGDAVPADVDDLHALNGAEFTVTLNGKKRKGTVKLGEERHADH